MKAEISIRDYQPEDVQALAKIYYNTIHKINIQHYLDFVHFSARVLQYVDSESVANYEGRLEKPLS
jgi:hypothetical protein